MNTRISSAFAVLAILGGVVLFACGDDDNAVKEGSVDAGPKVSSSGGSDGGPNTSSSTSSSGNGSSSGGGLGDGGCFLPPYTSHFQIINGCTDADEIEVPQTKSSRLQSDGGLPPLH